MAWFFKKPIRADKERILREEEKRTAARRTDLYEGLFQSQRMLELAKSTLDLMEPKK